jgi:hypothetical protein
MQKQIEYVKTLDKDIKDSLRWYTGDEYKSFNECLRYGLKMTHVQKTHLANIDFAFENAPPLDSQIIVYKGIIGKNIFSDKAFISTSKYYENTLKFAETYNNCCVMKITVTEGSRILPVQSLTQYKDEEEILLDRDGVLICYNTYIHKEKKEEDMNILCCTYTKGIIIEKTKDIKEAIVELKEEEDEKTIINRILDLVDEEELELYDNEKDIKYYIISLNKQISKKNLDKDSIEIIYTRMKSKYKI